MSSPFQIARSLSFRYFIFITTSNPPLGGFFMRSNSKHTAKELEKYIHLYIHEGINYKILCKEYGLLLERLNFNNKVLRYQEHGLAGIQLLRQVIVKVKNLYKACNIQNGIKNSSISKYRVIFL